MFQRDGTSHFIFPHSLFPTYSIFRTFSLMADIQDLPPATSQQGDACHAAVTLSLESHSIVFFVLYSPQSVPSSSNANMHELSPLLIFGSSFDTVAYIHCYNVTCIHTRTWRLACVKQSKYPTEHSFTRTTSC